MVCSGFGEYCVMYKFYLHSIHAIYKAIKGSDMGKNKIMRGQIGLQLFISSIMSLSTCFAFLSVVYIHSAFLSNVLSIKTALVNICNKLFSERI